MTNKKHAMPASLVVEKLAEKLKNIQSAFVKYSGLHIINSKSDNDYILCCTGIMDKADGFEVVEDCSHERQMGNIYLRLWLEDPIFGRIYAMPVELLIGSDGDVGDDWADVFKYYNVPEQLIKQIHQKIEEDWL